MRPETSVQVIFHALKYLAQKKIARKLVEV
jgi:hypothetical protein